VVIGKLRFLLGLTALVLWVLTELLWMKKDERDE
jgi:hypothetical protein